MGVGGRTATSWPGSGSSGQACMAMTSSFRHRWACRQSPAAFQDFKKSAFGRLCRRARPSHVSPCCATVHCTGTSTCRCAARRASDGTDQAVGQRRGGSTWRVKPCTKSQAASPAPLLGTEAEGCACRTWAFAMFPKALNACMTWPSSLSAHCCCRKKVTKPGTAFARQRRGTFSACRAASMTRYTPTRAATGWCVHSSCTSRWGAPCLAFHRRRQARASAADPRAASHSTPQQLRGGSRPPEKKAYLIHLRPMSSAEDPPSSNEAALAVVSRVPPATPDTRTPAATRNKTSGKPSKCCAAGDLIAARSHAVAVSPCLCTVCSKQSLALAVRRASVHTAVEVQFKKTRASIIATNMTFTAPR